MLTWNDPPPVTVPHSYSSNTVGYRIYRRDPDEVEFRPIGTSSERRYSDSAVRRGTTYEYAVRSIHERNVEGTLSDPPVTASVP